LSKSIREENDTLINVMLCHILFVLFMNYSLTSGSEKEGLRDFKAPLKYNTMRWTFRKEQKSLLIFVT